MSKQSPSTQLCACCQTPIAPGAAGADINVYLAIRQGPKTAIAAPICPVCTERAKTGINAAIEIMRTSAANALGNQGDQ